MTGQGFTPYGGHNFRTIVEARWAAFFDAQRDPWDYDPEEGWGLGNEQLYRPQFCLPRLDGYLEVQRPGDHRIPQPHEEHFVYLAVGDFPDEQQLRATGWWDSERGRGVKNLTRCYDWGDWFPPDYDDVLRAVEVARTKEFGPEMPPRP